MKGKSRWHNQHDRKYYAHTRLKNNSVPAYLDWNINNIVQNYKNAILELLSKKFIVNVR